MKNTYEQKVNIIFECTADTSDFSYLLYIRRSLSLLTILRHKTNFKTHKCDLNNASLVYYIRIIT